MSEQIRKGDVFYADLSPVVGSEQGGLRPVLVIQNNIGNRFSPTVIIAAITSKISKPRMQTHVAIKKSKDGLEKDSVVLLEQIRTIDKMRLQRKVTHLNRECMNRVNHALEISLGLIHVH